MDRLSRIATFPATATTGPTTDSRLSWLGPSRNAYPLLGYVLSLAAEGPWDVLESRQSVLHRKNRFRIIEMQPRIEDQRRQCG